jgi:hypothetical protein
MEKLNENDIMINSLVIIKKKQLNLLSYIIIYFFN